MSPYVILQSVMTVPKVDEPAIELDNWMNGLLRLLLRVWFFLLFGAIFLVLLVVGSVGVLIFTLWALVTGKRMDASVMLKNILQTSQKFRGGNWPPEGMRRPNSTSDVVEVQAHEVHDVKSLDDQR